MNRAAWRSLCRQPWLLAVVVWLPPVLFVLLISIFRMGTPQSLPVGVVNLDHSHESHTLERQLDASPGLSLQRSYPSASAGVNALQQTEILALIIIPNNFGRDLRLSISPTVTAFYNNQYLLSGKFINSSLISASMDLAARTGVGLRVSHGQNILEAAASAVPIRPQVTSLYNPNMSYARFLVTSISPALWQILIVIATVLALSRLLENQRLPDASLARGKYIASALAPISLLLWFQGLLMLWLFYHYLGWRPSGNVLWLFIGLALTVLSVQSMAVLIVALVKDRVKAMSVSAAYLAPAFAFMGITFPRGDMNAIAWAWGGLMPSTHYIKLQVDIADHGASLFAIFSSLSALLLFLLVLPFALALLPEQLDPKLSEQVASR
ncbi:MAG TPA: ABC transporter permease [Marinobacter sp.]|uniref:ABC transporter permease n=1 Tax=Marinobacter sp. TaxID=50741 RepID=UPI002D7EBCE0|nr:ABC transporter permease [Marinobacter sp.]HET8801137.1 ABC transporter permease [Marinobacter sp.]